MLQMNTETKTKLNCLREIVEKCYREKGGELPFHGWHHISFVQKKSLEFGKPIGADLFFVESAALVHDINYMVQSFSDPEAGSTLRSDLLKEAGYIDLEIERIEKIILNADVARRGTTLSLEEQALSDADSLFKVLPITPVIFSAKYIAENKVDLLKLAQIIVRDQAPLMEEGIYFYTDLAKKKYLIWAKSNLELWSQILESLGDPDVQELLQTAREIGVL
jgi:uncharacterized protein